MVKPYIKLRWIFVYQGFSITVTIDLLVFVLWNIFYEKTQFFVGFIWKTEKHFWGDRENGKILEWGKDRYSNGFRKNNSFMEC